MFAVWLWWLEWLWLRGFLRRILLTRKMRREDDEIQHNNEEEIYVFKFKIVFAQTQCIRDCKSISSSVCASTLAIAMMTNPHHPPIQTFFRHLQINMRHTRTTTVVSLASSALASYMYTVQYTCHRKPIASRWACCFPVQEPHHTTRRWFYYS